MANAYVCEGIVQWQLTFHANFYQEIFRQATTKAKMPRSAAGNPTARYFQFLTADAGYEHLKPPTITVNALMSVARN